jgi:hypothetical protein
MWLDDGWAFSVPGYSGNVWGNTQNPDAAAPEKEEKGMKRRASVLVAAIVCAGLFPACAGGASGTGSEIGKIRAELIQRGTAFVLGQQITGGEDAVDGALLMGPGYRAESGGKIYDVVEPYFNNIAVIHLLEDATPEITAAAKGWIRWYFTNINDPDVHGLSGTIYTYYVGVNDRNDVFPRETLYDSTDAYAAVFLRLLWRYFEASGDAATLVSHEDKIHLIVGAMLTTTRPSGLTGARPDYPVEYLMDNCEVYDGLDALVSLYGPAVLNDAAQAAYYAERKRAIAAAIEDRLFLPETGLYAPYLGAAKPEMTIFYPDAAAQVFPILFGLTDPVGTRAGALLRAFDAALPDWPAFRYDTFPWMLVGKAFFLNGERSKVERMLENYLSAINGPAYEGLIVHEAGVAVWLAKKSAPLK